MPVGQPVDVLAVFRGADYTTADLEAAALLWLSFLRDATPANEPAFVARRAADEFGGEVRRALRGDVSLSRWQLRTARDVADLHLAAAYRGAGEELDAAAELVNAPPWQAHLRYVLGRLNRFAAQMAAGQVVEPEGAARRAGLYAESAIPPYWQGATALAVARGLTEARRILGVAEHCAGCVREAGRDWHPIPTLAPIGSQECGQSCKCRVIFR